MRLVVQLFALLRERAGTGELVLEGLPDALDVAGLKREIAARHPELGDLTHVAGVVGTEYVRDDTALSEGDEVALLPPVSGGAPEADPDPGDALARGLFELSASALDPGAAHARVADPGCGAVVVFTGVTRATNRGKGVQRLDYEAFERMAGPEMARIFEECRARFGDDDQRLLRMLCVHRTGTVTVGLPSVVIAVASPHRDAAFGAARFLIDALKERLPVWKKEVYADGQHWIGDRS
jgi:molybdopterin synthase catalytic subunit